MKFMEELKRSSLLKGGILGISLLMIILFSSSIVLADDEAPVKHLFNLKKTEDGTLNYPADVKVAPNGEIFVLDTGNNQIVVYDQEGNYLRQFGDGGDDEGEVEYPLSFAINKKNQIYIADTENHRVEVLDKNGNYLFEFGIEGEEGDKEGQFNRPIGITIGNDGLVYVSDLKNHRIQVFNQKGEFITIIGEFGRRDGQFKYPVGLITAPESNDLYVVDTLNFRIQIFEEDGKKEWEFDDTFGRVGNREGSFARPKDIAIDEEERIYVTDSFLGLVQVLDDDGEFLFKIGGETKKPLFKQALGIYIDDKTNRLYVADRGNNQIQVYKITDLK